MSTFCRSRAKGVSPPWPQRKGVWPQGPGDGQSDLLQLPGLRGVPVQGLGGDPEEGIAPGSQTRRPTGFDFAPRPGLGNGQRGGQGARTGRPFPCSLDSRGDGGEMSVNPGDGEAPPEPLPAPEPGASTSEHMDGLGTVFPGAPPHPPTMRLNLNFLGPCWRPVRHVRPGPRAAEVITLWTECPVAGPRGALDAPRTFQVLGSDPASGDEGRPTDVGMQGLGSGHNGAPSSQPRGWTGLC